MKRLRQTLKMLQKIDLKRRKHEQQIVKKSQTIDSQQQRSLRMIGRSALGSVVLRKH